MLGRHAQRAGLAGVAAGRGEQEARLAAQQVVGGARGGDPGAQDGRGDHELRVPGGAAVGRLEQEARAVGDVAEAIDDQVAPRLRGERDPVGLLGAGAGQRAPRLARVGRPPQRAALGQEVAVLGVEEVDVDEAGRLAVDRRLVQRLPRLAAVGRAQQVARARGEERAAGAVDRVEPGLRDVLALDGRERVRRCRSSGAGRSDRRRAPSRSSARSARRAAPSCRCRASSRWRRRRWCGTGRPTSPARSRRGPSGRRRRRRPRRSRRCRASTSCRRRSSWRASRCRPARTPCPSGRRRARACRSRSGARRSGRSSARRRRRRPWRPVAPPAAMRVAEAKPAAKIGSCEGVTSLRRGAAVVGAHQRPSPARWS